MPICLFCNTPTSNAKFCSASCSAKFNNAKRPPRSLEWRLHQRAGVIAHLTKINPAFSAKPYPGKRPEVTTQKAVGPVTWIQLKNCTFCQRTFWSRRLPSTRYPTTCSDTCFKRTKAKNATGIKRVSSASGEVFDSSWELHLAQWLDDNHIQRTEPAAVVWTDSKSKSRRYFCDFYLPALKLYVDPKNPLVIQKQAEKLAAVGQLIDLIYGSPDTLKSEILSRLTQLNQAFNLAPPTGIEPVASSWTGRHSSQ